MNVKEPILTALREQLSSWDELLANLSDEQITTLKDYLETGKGQSRQQPGESEGYDEAQSNSTSKYR